MREGRSEDFGSATELLNHVWLYRIGSEQGLRHRRRAWIAVTGSASRARTPAGSIRPAGQLDRPSWGYLLDANVAYSTGAMTPPAWREEGVSDPTARIDAVGR